MDAFLIAIVNSLNNKLSENSKLKMRCAMKIKLSIFLFSISAILSGCMTTVSTPSAISKGITGKLPDKTLSDGTHIKDLPMSRDFILEVPDPTPTTKVMAGNPKINSIKPDNQGTTKPRAVVLLDNNPFPFNLNVRRKNIIVCEGFMSLPSVDLLEQEGKNKGDEKSANRKNHLITYMPAQKDAELPNTSKDCSKFISKGYDFINSKDEILYLIDKGNFKKIAKSPYIAIYESRTSPYSSMILSLGQLNPVAINRLTSNWPELLVKVYNHGDNIEDLTLASQQCCDMIRY